MEKIKKYTIITVVVLFVFFAGLMAGIVAVSRYLETEDAAKISMASTIPMTTPKGPVNSTIVEHESPETTAIPKKSENSSNLDSYEEYKERIRELEEANPTKSPEEAPSKNMESNDNSGPGRLVVPEAREIPFI